jgi:hypothetical protein
MTSIKSLKLPVQVISGQICDNNGNVLIKANREIGTTPLNPSERDTLMYLVADLINKEFPVMKESKKESELKPLNEAQIGDKVAFGKEQGYVIGQMSDGSWIVQIQYSTKVAKDSQLKVLKGLAQKGAMKPPMKFDDKTQKLLFEQYVHCGIFYNTVPIKTTHCYVKYSDMLADSPTVNVLVEGDMQILPKEQIRLFENPNDFANPQDYVPGVTVDEETEEATGNCLVHAGDYSQAVGDADSCRCIFGSENQEPRMETLPRSRVRTLSV